MNTQKNKFERFDRSSFQPISLSNFGGQLVTFISVGEDHASAINMNGELFCWGNNDYGQCGTDKC